MPSSGKKIGGGKAPPVEDTRTTKSEKRPAASAVAPSVSAHGRGMKTTDSAKYTATGGPKSTKFGTSTKLASAKSVTPARSEEPKTDPSLPDISALALRTGLATPEPASLRSAPKPFRTSSSQSVISAASAQSLYSLPSKDPRGSVNHVFRRTMLSNYTKLFGIPRTLHGPAENKLQTLMLKAGQGGTFAFGNWFKDDRGKTIAGRGSTGPAYANTKTKHLTKFGSNVTYVGTMDCYTCLAVYFEIKENRFFFAHINAWHSTNSYDIAALDRKRSPSTYQEIRDAVKFRLEAHAIEHNWSLKDVKYKTIRLACPNPAATAGAVLDAVVIDFLHCPKMHPVDSAHGFVMMPGARTDDGQPVGELLTVREEVIDGLPQFVHDALPAEVEERPYEIDKVPMPMEWCYTAGIGWHHIPDDGSRFDLAT